MWWQKWSVHRRLRLARRPVRQEVVDNASADGTAAMVRRELPEATLLEAGANLGFARYPGVDVDPAWGTGRELCERLLARRVLAKDTHGSTIRLAPPLTIDPADLEWAMDQLTDALRSR